MNTKLNYVTNWEDLASKSGWSVSALAKFCGVSVRTLHRHFLLTTGKSTKSWLIEQRQRSAENLLSSGLSVKETAFRLAYKQHSSFTRWYKTASGKGPGGGAPFLNSSASENE